MAPPAPSWLLRLAAICHLTMLMAGQHHGVKKCSVVCSKMHPEINVDFLVNYQRTEASCRKPAIIFKTQRKLQICADPKEQWVQKAIEHLDHRAAAPTQNGGTFEKQIGMGEPRSAPATSGMNRSAVTEPRATGESSSQEAKRASGASPELPTGEAGSRGNRNPSTSKAADGGPPVWPETTEPFSPADVNTAILWQSSAAYRPGSVLGAEEKASEAPSTQTLSTPALSTEVSSTQTLALSTQDPTISHTAPEDNTRPEGQPVWTKGQKPTPENSLGPKETGPTSAHMDAFPGLGSTPRVPVSSAGAPSREPVASGSWGPKAKETIHATVDPQKLGVLITPVPDSQVATRRQAVGLLAFLGLLFCLGVAMFAYQSLQGCPHKLSGDMVEGLRCVPRNCASNSYVLVPV
ncbi:fractalkine isoform X2 [Manis pentadactyla]|uniref:fractalkine isoform X2 n=1 Tax=Manis pentadactyla TaxID=143292 RepID=UPI00255D15CD|nr:fractalkine isoform X2 [Manis pentadactyla]KAI5143199.1 Fractalkine [Manis pentadactyla]